jgi:hypothetical protein
MAWHFLEYKPLLTGQDRFASSKRYFDHFIKNRVTQRAGTPDAAYPMTAIMIKSIALPPYPMSGKPTISGVRK